MLYRGREDRRALVEVTELGADEVRFARQGGGFGCRMARVDFDLRFEPAPDGPFGLIRGTFTADFLPGETLAGYHDGTLWNGWAKPLLPLGAAMRLVDTQENLRWDMVTGEVVEDQFGEEYRWRPRIAETPDGPLLLWPAGDGWCWDFADTADCGDEAED